MYQIDLLVTSTNIYLFIQLENIIWGEGCNIKALPRSCNPQLRQRDILAAIA